MKTLIYLAFLFPIGLKAQTAPALFAEALAAQQKAEHQRAIVLYDSVLNQQLYSSELYHNLALCHYELNHTGKAVLYLQKSLALNPHNAAALHNLKVVQQSVQAPVKPLQLSFLGNLIHSTAGLFSATVWAVIFLTLNLLICVVWTFIKKKPYLCAAVIATALLSLAAGFYQKHWVEEQKKAVLIKNFALRSQPNPQGEELQTISEGEILYILATDNEWFKVQLRDGMQGWLPAMSLETV